jgi:hypothetical protein
MRAIYERSKPQKAHIFAPVVPIRGRVVYDARDHTVKEAEAVLWIRWSMIRGRSVELDSKEGISLRKGRRIQRDGIYGGICSAVQLNLDEPVL